MFYMATIFITIELRS